MKPAQQALPLPPLDTHLSGHILRGAGPWGDGPLNVRGRTPDGRILAALATPSGAILDKRAPLVEVPDSFPPLVELMRVRGRAGLS